MSAILPVGGFAAILLLLLSRGKAKAAPGAPADTAEPGEETLSSPFGAVPAARWSQFVRLLARGREGTITPNARYGLFLFGVRRLADLGLVTNIRRGTYRGKTVWQGDWKPPYSSAAFLSSSRIQYRTFVKSMAAYARKYKAARAQNPGLFQLGGQPVTLSGFLALAHLAGFRGAVDFLRSGRRLPSTMALVAKANGLF